MTLSDYLSEAFVQHALIAATLVAVTAGLIGPLVIIRDLAFAVHGTAELAFTGAAAGLLVAENPLLGALLGSIVVATAIGLLGNRQRERNSAIGVILAFGLGVGVYLLSLYRGFATAATNILFGQIFGVSPGQITLLTGIAIGVLIAMALLYRPLLFASVDPELAAARGVRTGLVGLLFVYVLALTVTEAAQIVGTLLVLSLAITPAAAASRFSARTPVVIAISIAFALIAADGGLLLSLVRSDVKASVFISTISFGCYALARAAARFVLPVFAARRTPEPGEEAAASDPGFVSAAEQPGTRSTNPARRQPRPP
jgi:zinc/manganese transport system permease protein